MDSLDPILSRCDRKPGAGSEAVAAMTAQLGQSLPDDYLAFLESSNGAEGWIGENYVQFYSAQEVAEHGRHEAYPKYVFIGSDGGGEGFAYDMSVDPPPIVNLPFIGGEHAIARVLSTDLLAFLERLARAPLFDVS
jgi:hypothetical protein